MFHNLASGKICFLKNFLYYCFVLLKHSLNWAREFPQGSSPMCLEIRPIRALKRYWIKQVICPKNLLRKLLTMGSEIKGQPMDMSALSRSLYMVYLWA